MYVCMYVYVFKYMYEYWCMLTYVIWSSLVCFP